MKKKTKTAYTHPTLAKYLRELFEKGEPYGWGGLQHDMEIALIATVQEMIANQEIIFAPNNLMRIPQEPVRIVTKDKPTKKQHKESGCKKATHQPAPASKDKPKRHEGG